MKNFLISASIALVVLVGFTVYQLNVETEVGYTDQYGGYVVTKTLTSSEILTTGIDVSNVVKGDLAIDNIIIETDSTGLATGTNFTIYTSGNDFGATAVLTHAVSSLGANATVDLNSATVKQRTVLEDGSKLVALCSAADCEGAGEIKITIFLSKVDSTGYIYE